MAESISKDSCRALGKLSVVAKVGGHNSKESSRGIREVSCAEKIKAMAKIGGHTQLWKLQWQKTGVSC